MYIVNASKIKILDAKKLSKTKSSTANKISEECIDSTPDGPSTIWIKHLAKVNPDDEDECYKKLIEIAIQHPEHFYLLEEKYANQIEKNYELKLPDNVFLGHIVSSNAQIPNPQADHDFRWLVIREPESFTEFAGLEKYDWVIMHASGSDNINPENISCALLLKHCNQRSLPVCIYPINSDLDIFEAALHETDNGKHSPLFYELPITDNHTLMMAPDGLDKDVSDTDDNLKMWKIKYNTATMAMAYNLFKLINMARNVGQKSFWKTYFQVSSAEKFATDMLEVSRSQMYRYLQAITVCEKLFPELMEKVVAGESEVPKKVLSYSRFQVVFPFIYDMEKNPNGIKDQVKRMLLDPGVTASEIRAMLNGEFPKESTNKCPEPFNIIETLMVFNGLLMSQMVEGKRAYLFQYLKKIFELYLASWPLSDSQGTDDPNTERSNDNDIMSNEDILLEALGVTA